jgi:hypothetical protein
MQKTASPRGQGTENGRETCSLEEGSQSSEEEPQPVGAGT